MSEIQFIFTPEDKIDFATWLSDKFETVFVVDDDQPKITEIRQVKDIQMVLTGKHPPLIFILSDLWSFLPLYKRKATNRYKGDIHYIQQKYGGPSFTWMPGNWLEREGRPAIAGGFFGDYPYYYVAPNSHDTIDRPPKMVEAYREVQRKIKSICTGRRVIFKGSGNVGPWISASAHGLIKDGSASLANENFCINPNAA